MIMTDAALRLHDSSAASVREETEYVRLPPKGLPGYRIELSCHIHQPLCSLYMTC